ncbi:hypothetical protein BD311DRAFT_384567 [Dichomitus squalens]|uniref:Uncharacterized protein n=1 Tax=Dichomitus squalens TaxID=114155 RepID=A0A4V6MVW9_9APHY|nr:hypothetical protein BD311DRAFT_384567 [Dichomitus squalens]
MYASFPQTQGQNVYSVGGDSGLYLLRATKVCCLESIGSGHLTKNMSVRQRYSLPLSSWCMREMMFVYYSVLSNSFGGILYVLYPGLHMLTYTRSSKYCRPSPTRLLSCGQEG